MAEEKIVPQPDVTKTADDYIDAIAKLKASSVDRSEYEAVRAENKKLLDSLVNGSKVEVKEKGPSYRDPAEISKELSDLEHPLNNLQMAERLVEFRESMLANGYKDPALAYGPNITPDSIDEQAAEQTHAIIQHCIEYAEGNNEVFTNELYRILEDAMPMRGKKR